MHHQHPKLMRDHYFAEVAPNQLPYTIASEQYAEEYPKFSASTVNIPQNVQNIIDPDDETVSYIFKHFFTALFTKQTAFILQTVDGMSDGIVRRFLSNLRKRRGKRHSNSKNKHFTVEMSNMRYRDEEETDQCDRTEFDKLREERSSLRKKKMLEYVELLKNSSNDDYSTKLTDNLL